MLRSESGTATSYAGTVVTLPEFRYYNYSSGQRTVLTDAQQALVDYITTDPAALTNPFVQMLMTAGQNGEVMNSPGGVAEVPVGGGVLIGGRTYSNVGTHGPRNAPIANTIDLEIETLVVAREERRNPSSPIPTIALPNDQTLVWRVFHEFMHRAAIHTYVNATGGVAGNIALATRATVRAEATYDGGYQAVLAIARGMNWSQADIDAGLEREIAAAIRQFNRAREDYLHNQLNLIWLGASQEQLSAATLQELRRQNLLSYDEPPASVQGNPAALAAWEADRSNYHIVEEGYGSPGLHQADASQRVVSDISDSAKKTVEGVKIIKKGEYDGEDTKLVFTKKANGTDEELATTSLEDFAQVFGSSIGRQLAGDDLFLQVAYGSILGTIGLNIGQAIDASNGLSVKYVNNGVGAAATKANASAVWLDFANELSGMAVNSAIGSVSSYLSMELGEALGLEGFGAELFNTLSGALITHTLNNLASYQAILNGVALNTETWFASKGVTTAGMSAQVEIITGRRTVMDYLLSPIARATSEAGRER